MAVQQQRTSRTRRDKRRTHQKLVGLSGSVCPECNSHKRPHHACQACGVYKGREVIKTEED